MASAADRYRTLLDAASAVADQPTVKAVLHSLRGVLASTCALHGVFLYVLDDDGDSLHVLEFDREPDAPPIKTGTRISRIGAVAQVLEEQKPVFIPDVSQEMLKHPELAPFAAESVGRGTYVFPVSTSQQRCGVLVVTKDRGQEFAPEDVELLRSLASHVAVALECALARDSAELYQRQVALLTFALDNIRDEAFLSDDKARFHYVNEEACRVLGYTRAELLGMTVPDIDLQIPAERWPERWLELKTQRALSFESRHRTRDGRIFPVAISGNYFEYGGGAYCLALVRDITERKKAEEALKRSEAYLAEAQELSRTGSWAFDVASNKYIYLSEECFRIFEMDAKEGPPTREAVSRLICPEDWDKVRGDLEKLLREKVDTSSEFRIVLPSGATKHLQTTRHPVLNDAGDVVQVVGTVVDITERKRAEEALRDSEARLRLAAWAAELGVFEWDAASDTARWENDRMFEIFGRTQAEGPLSSKAFYAELLEPEDRPVLDRAITEAMRPDHLLKMAYRIRRRNDGQQRWIEYSARDLAPAGSPSRIVGVIADITERKLADEELRTSQAQLAQERDRLSLLLEINNHIVSKLEVNDLFQAVAASMRKHVGNDATAFWLIDKKLGRLERRFLDFPTGRGFLAKTNVGVLPNVVSENWFRVRIPHTDSAEMASVLPNLREALRAESLVSVVLVPLVGADGPLGLLVMGSRKTNAFSDGDLDVLSQIGTQISSALDNALAYERLRASHDDLQDQRLYLESEITSECNFEDIVGKSVAIQNVMKQVAIVAPTDSTVLLHGETGTGKELVARAIHRSSPRRERTFVRLNCAAIPSGLLESELFGHEKGAFTGALMQKKGRFELADRGTLFLDEIGDISLELQPKLLRAVQEQEFERLGSTKTIQVNVRIIAATHRDIAAMIRSNQFREDLFYRLNVFPIEIPPLRERPGDVSLLVHYFVSRLARRMRKNIKTIPKHAMEALVNASWPGNVRELENFIERAVILTQGSELNVPMAELKSAMRTPRTGSLSTFHDAERQAIIDALKAASGKLAGTGGAAERLGLKRTTLQNKMRRLQIPRSDH